MTTDVEPRARLRDAVDRILDVFVERDASDDEFTEWAGIAEDFASRLEAIPPETVAWGLGSRGIIAVAGVPTLVAEEPDLSGERARMVVTYGREHQGHGGWVHGGAIGASFDELLGIFQTFVEPRVVTAELTIRYRVPIPLGAIVVFEGEIASRQGRKLRVSGRASIGDTVHAEAEALFIAMRVPGDA